MHARELIELAALASVHGPALIQAAESIPADAIEAYWTASKSRLDRWGRTLKSFARRATVADEPFSPGELATVRGVLEEILTGEILTRVWSAVLGAYDRYHATDRMEPVARSVLSGHLEARHRVLALLVSGPGIDAEQAVKLNRLRRRTERWTDVLVGRLAGLGNVSQFAVDPKRARDFAEDLDRQSAQPGGRHAWPILLASLRAAFGVILGPASPNADLNAAIAASVLSCFPSELFDSTGLLHSAWLLRISHVTNDTQGMIDELLALDEARPSDQSSTAPPRTSDRTRRFGKPS